MRPGRPADRTRRAASRACGLPRHRSRPTAPSARTHRARRRSGVPGASGPAGRASPTGPAAPGGGRGRRATRRRPCRQRRSPPRRPSTPRPRVPPHPPIRGVAPSAGRGRPSPPRARDRSVPPRRARPRPARSRPGRSRGSSRRAAAHRGPHRSTGRAWPPSWSAIAARASPAPPTIGLQQRAFAPPGAMAHPRSGHSGLPSPARSPSAGSVPASGFLAAPVIGPGRVPDRIVDD